MGRMLMIAVTAAMLCAGRAHAISGGTKSDFQDGTVQNWGSGNSLTNVATGGPAGAGDMFLNVESFGSNLATFNTVAPWPGDYAAAGITDIELDMRNPNASAMDMRIVLFFNNTDRWTSSLSQAVPADNVWHHYSFSLKEADLTHVLGSSTYPQLYSAVERLMVRYNPGAPSSTGTPFVGSLDLDNITAVVPEPVNLGLLATAGLASLRRRTRF